MRFRVNDDLVDNWNLNQNTLSNAPNDETFQQHTISGVELATGDTLAIEGISDLEEFARVDFLTLSPQSLFDVDSDLTTAVSGTETFM
ncbi:MAG: hypothetical protein QNJ72_40180 [Pleurocapsa sp. MO_226.B13]|nr:hypothetical protein [Pleurocapsa sp. MO_226.B13]